MKNNITSSFRDPSGFIFKQNNQILRQVNYSYKDNYDFLISSGLYEELTKLNFLIPHTETALGNNKDAYKILAPTLVPTISYPYEWCFSQLKDAALLTLKIQKTALQKGMSLKDATSFNIQFLQGQPILIDTLSFEKYVQGEPWVAYKQFCEQFLAPLALYSQVDTRLIGLLQSFVGNIPLDLAAKLLPKSSRFNFSLLIHIFLHARSQSKYAGRAIKQSKKAPFSKNSLLALIDNLESATNGLSLKQSRTTWNTYYDDNNNYTKTSFEEKEKLVGSFLRLTKASLLWDVGSNSGNFSRVAAQMGINTISMDNDLAVVEQNYLSVKKNKETRILPLFQDITSPTPAVGWANDERTSFEQRSQPDCILALAVIHHLAIGSNLPFSYISKYFAKLSKYLIIEFVPKEDSQVKILLQQRLDIFPNYNQKEFELQFSKYFTILKKAPISQSMRTLYLMQKK